ncbi:hypothetical protein [Pseudomonas sp. OTU5201]|uniref:hypothetical protein n=1 Tax=Pseudomonas sp. OTU5201 TaxID=3043850 RepID=UPI00313AEC10
MPRINFSVTWHRYILGMFFVSNTPVDAREELAMDDYQEEILDFHATEQDPVEPAEDATEM